MITYKTSSPSGDLISFLSGVRQLWLDTGEKGVIYHRLNMIGSSYEGAESPYLNKEGYSICFNQYCFEMMRPLILSQPYIEDYIIFDGQQHDVDLDKVRLETFTNQPKGSLNRWMNHVFPQMASNLSEKWLNIPKIAGYKEIIIINITARHRNTFMDYFFLKEHSHRLMFAGLSKERDVFCSEFSIEIPLLTVSNFYELAMVLNSCKFILANQSFVFQLSESMKIPRMLELFPLAPNVIPIGENAYDYYHNDECKFYFNKLLNL